MHHYDPLVVADEGTGRPLVGVRAEVVDAETLAPVTTYRDEAPVPLISGPHGLIGEFQTDETTRRVRITAGTVTLHRWCQEIADAAQAAADRASAAAAEAETAANAAGASVLADAKAYTDQKVTGLATTAAMQAGDALTLSNAKTYTDEQLADFDSFVGVPIFETLAEAQAWEAANQGKRALTLEGEAPGTSPSDPIVVTPGTVIVADDFNAPDDTRLTDFTTKASLRSTPTGDLPWRNAVEADKVVTGHTSRRGVSAIAGGKLANSAYAYLDLPVSNVDIDLDWTMPASMGSTFFLAVAFGGFEWRAQSSNTTFRLFEVDGWVGKVLVTNIGIPWTDSGHLTMSYDGVTFTIKHDGVQVAQRAFTIKDNKLGFSFTSGGYNTVGEPSGATLPSHTGIDNLTVTYRG